MARGKAGLTEQELTELTEQLAAGKRPRVQLSGPHFPVETTGTVVRVGSAELDGPDFVRVRVKVNGMTDELAFSPAELRRPGKPAGRPAAHGKAAGSARTAAAGAKATARSDGPAGPAPDAAPGDGVRPVPRTAPEQAAVPAEATPAGSPASAKTAPVKAAPAKTGAGRTPSGRTGSAASQPAAGDPSVRRRPSGSAAPAARRPAAGKGPAVTLTIASAGPSWTLTATRGAKNLAKAVPLPPGVVSAVAELLDQPGLSEAIGEINDVALAEARARAEQLRAELDELEAVLATHRSPSNAPGRRR